jgi:hypothetical protein
VSDERSEERGARAPANQARTARDAPRSGETGEAGRTSGGRY